MSAAADSGPDPPQQPGTSVADLLQPTANPELTMPVTLSKKQPTSSPSNNNNLGGFGPPQGVNLAFYFHHTNPKFKEYYPCDGKAYWEDETGKIVSRASSPSLACGDDLSTCDGNFTSIPRPRDVLKVPKMLNTGIVQHENDIITIPEDLPYQDNTNKLSPLDTENSEEFRYYVKDQVPAIVKKEPEEPDFIIKGKLESGSSTSIQHFRTFSRDFSPQVNDITNVNTSQSGPYSENINNPPALSERMRLPSPLSTISPLIKRTRTDKGDHKDERPHEIAKAEE
ncbi:hypothetical protein BU26DRAFT_571850 [Trematosphaeria pertusa]|uniref:Uncharacterized protein n=1 Tax=Trematosphaeria pertusa TaxID=390896 RepID=A0A6A6HT65_9PLEO|nr:uncharacterized protein BU26DRAFT_571850 [Trematosphaeria pertusa]KAF2241365.1 hypothetical protein BU26DRAFT_571850 [Trematosphaeria pertusa]